MDTKDIPEVFYRGDQTKPYCETVGELIEELQRLPEDLPIEQGMGGVGCRLVVYNIKSNPFLAVEDDD